MNAASKITHPGNETHFRRPAVRVVARVGTTWIGLGDDYGIHGTPNPQSIGRSQSHGCVHLTNWDAQALAKMIHRGTKVEFIN
jgi:lipoprotein-anchoring transpeptidase ErfK/SrfK